MAVRFRKSVKICKGVKVNFSKSGASLSLGGRGHGVTFGGSGTHAHVGIPGTGLSYNTRTGSHSRSHIRSQASSRSTSSKPTVQVPKQIGIRMDDKGKVIIEDGNGVEITNQAVLRKIKATAQYQAQVAQLDAQRREKIDEMVRDAEAENERFINICELSAIVDPLSRFQSRLNSIKPVEYVMAEFDVPAPTKERIREFLVKEAESTVKGSIFKIGKLRRQYVEDNLDQRYTNALSAWEADKDDYYAFQEEEKLAADEAAAEECEQQRSFLRALIDGDESAICEVFDSWIATCELPVEINISYDWKPSTGTMLLDVDLPEIEDLAQTKLVKTDAGNLKEKKKTQAELRSEYSTLVFGLAIFIVSHTFNVSPAVQRVLISGYTQRTDKDGNIKDDYIYSVKFTRDMFEQRDLSRIVPKDFCLSAENKCNMTSTSLFKAIVPFDSFE